MLTLMMANMGKKEGKNDASNQNKIQYLSGKVVSLFFMVNSLKELKEMHTILQANNESNAPIY